MRALAMIVAPLFWIAALAAAGPETTLPMAISTPLPDIPASFAAAPGDGYVEAIVFVDEHGRVSHAVSGDSSHIELEKPVTDAMKAWTFAPGLQEGEPSQRNCILRVTFKGGSASVGPVMDMYKPDVMPKLVRSVPPVYPKELLKSGNHGLVKVAFILNARGEIVAPRVVESSHPAFEEAAIAAISAWKFSPAKLKGRAVPMYLGQPVRFMIGGGGTADAFTVNKARKRNVPDFLKVDELPKPEVVVFAVHPYEQALKGEGGSAVVVFVVGADGSVTASSINRASQPEFGLALAAAAEASTFKPAKRDGKPSQAVINREHRFKIGDRDSAIDAETENILKRIRRDRFKPADPNTLDAKPRPIFTNPPVYPTALGENGVTGSAKIEVIIDTKGRAVLPRIIEASEPEFGWAAATAVQRWRFEPPKVRGQPVEVKVTIPFNFTPLDPEEGEPAN